MATTRDIRSMAAELVELNSDLGLLEAVGHAASRLLAAAPAGARRTLLAEVCQELRTELGTDDLVECSAGWTQSEIRLALLYPPTGNTTATRYTATARKLARWAGELQGEIASLRGRYPNHGDAPESERTIHGSTLRTLEAALAALGKAEGECQRSADVAEALAAETRRVREAGGVMRRGDTNVATECGACATGESTCCR